MIRSAPAAGSFDDADRAELADLAPLARRGVGLDPSCLVRLRRDGRRLGGYLRLPFEVLVARTVDVPVDETDRPDYDRTVRGDELLAWIDGERDDPPTRRDAAWRSGLPPLTGWRRVDTVPDDEVRPLVRAGALALKDAAEREGLLAGSAAQPRAEVTDALLDAVVLTVDGPPGSAQITLRTLSAVTRMGFLPRGSYVAVDLTGRWTRVAAAYGSVFAERPGGGLGLLP